MHSPELRGAARGSSLVDHAPLKPLHGQAVLALVRRLRLALAQDGTAVQVLESDEWQTLDSP